MRMRTTALLALLAASGGAAPAQEKAAPTDPALLKSIEAIGTATRSVQSLKSAYLREYTKYGRAGAVVEEGQLLWKRTPEGVVSARWEGKDEDGAILTLVRNGKLSVWRGPKKTS